MMKSLFVFALLPFIGIALASPLPQASAAGGAGYTGNGGQASGGTVNKTQKSVQRCSPLESWRVVLIAGQWHLES